MGGRAPTPVRPGHGNCRNPRRKNGGGEVPDYLGQTNYAKICTLVTKYISKLNKIQNTNYMPCISLHISNTCISIT